MVILLECQSGRGRRGRSEAGSMADDPLHQRNRKGRRDLRRNGGTARNHRTIEEKQRVGRGEPIRVVHAQLDVMVAVWEI